MPSNPYDAKGLMISAIKDNNPIVYIDDRWLYATKGNVPKGIYSVPIGKGSIRRKGKDLTIVANSFMTLEAIKASMELQKEGIEVEVIDLRTVKPLDKRLIFSSVKKTGRLLIVDGGWTSFGVSAEISALISEEAFYFLKSPIMRVALPDTPAPSSLALEKEYYPNSVDIIKAAKRVVNIKRR